jgi:dihydrofolate reductase
MSSGRAGGATTRPTTTPCSSSPTARVIPCRWKEGPRSLVTDGIESALEQAKEAAGGQEVTLWGGGNIAQQYLAPGLLDELELHLVPVLLGGGARLFDNLGDAEVRLEQVRAVEAPGVTHLKYRVVS